jgi:UDP-N-acetylglucosamine--N-acetylmuramyl-(pentapeptide) pyrophosphoryl-undecaprenol N-acetylglucosamine transferase
MAVTVVLAGGGTGGHVFPALALGDTIRKTDPHVTVRYVGTEHGLENRLVREAGYPLDAVPARPVMGRGWAGALRGLLTIARGTLRARRLLRKLGADLVIGVGGYASFPAVAAAATLGIPTGLLNPDARPGRANRILGRLARGIFVQFEEAEPFFPPGRVYRFGIPVRTMPERAPTGDAGRVRLLVFGGSQGARSINRAIAGSLERLAGLPLDITHQTGAQDLEEVRAAYAREKRTAEVAPFFDDIPERLSRADLVVARAGAATVAELCAAGVASILIPYPYAADDHQTANARALERAGACVVVPDAEAASRLAGEIEALTGDASRRSDMARAARSLGSRDAAERIWEVCAAWVRGGRNDGGER